MNTLVVVDFCNGFIHCWKAQLIDAHMDPLPMYAQKEPWLMLSISKMLNELISR